MASVLKGDVIRMVFYPSARDRRRQFGRIRTAAFDRLGKCATYLKVRKTQFPQTTNRLYTIT